MDELIMDEEVLDFEIALYSREKDSILATASSISLQDIT